MTNKLSLLLLPLLTLACGGAEFSNRVDTSDVAGAAGETTGGAPGAGGGTVTGGSAGTPGAGGAAGAAGAGAPSTGGGAATGGSAGTAGACSASSAITAARAPTSFVWGGFESSGGDGEREWCAYSTGSTCSLEVLEITLSADATVGSMTAKIECDAEVFGGECGIEGVCGNIQVGRNLSVPFTVAKSAMGFVTEKGGRIALPVSAGSCEKELTSESSELSAEASLWQDAASAIDGKLWVCP